VVERLQNDNSRTTDDYETISARIVGARGLLRAIVLFGRQREPEGLEPRGDEGMYLLAPASDGAIYDSATD
jgi:hypothetical protein